MCTERAGRQRWRCALVCRLVVLAAAAACDGSDDSDRDAGAPLAPVFPADFAEHYEEQRDCRHSHEHELRYIRVMVSESAREPYARLSPEVPYPEGATLVKLEYDDEACTELVEYTAYRKLEAGANPAGGDWLWQRVSPEREVLEHGAPWLCVACHTAHCARAGEHVPERGYDLTCAEEL